jgi:hypothetical protein
MAKPRPQSKFPSEQMRLWFFYFTAQDNPDTFLKPGPSAKAAGYRCRNKNNFCKVGWAVKKKLAPHVEAWLKDYGLDEQSLKMRLIKLMEARETRFIKINGTPIELADGVRQLAETVQSKISACGDSYNEEHSILAFEIENLGIQLKATETALKMQGMLKDELRVTGLENLAERLAEANERVKK